MKDSSRSSRRRFLKAGVVAALASGALTRKSAAGRQKMASTTLFICTRTTRADIFVRMDTTSLRRT